MANAERYSDTRVKNGFFAYILLSDPLQFRTGDILAAVREDYPSLVWTDSLNLDTPFDTNSFGMGAFFSQESDGPEPSMTRLTSIGGRLQVNWDDVLWTSRTTNPEGRAAVAAHVNHLCISLQSVDSTLPARFDAARRLTCLAAVFAKLPTCTGVYFPSANQLVSPASWVTAADTAITAKFPSLQWISLGINRSQDAGEDDLVTVGTIGLAAFNGTEIVLPKTRLPAGDAAKWVHGAAVMLAGLGHSFVDGDTLGREGQPDRVRLRFVPEGKYGMQTDCWFLIHPKCTLDEFARFGKRSRPPASTGVDNSVRSDDGWLGKKLYAVVAGGGR